MLNEPGRQKNSAAKRRVDFRSTQSSSATVRRDSSMISQDRRLTGRYPHNPGKSQYEKKLREIMSTEHLSKQRMTRAQVDQKLANDIMDTIGRRKYAIEQYMRDNPEDQLEPPQDLGDLRPPTTELQQKMDRLNIFASSFIEKRREAQAQALIKELVVDLNKFQQALEKDAMMMSITEDEDMEEEELASPPYPTVPPTKTPQTIKPTTVGRPQWPRPAAPKPAAPPPKVRIPSIKEEKYVPSAKVERRDSKVEMTTVTLQLKDPKENQVKEKGKGKRRNAKK